MGRHEANAANHQSSGSLQGWDRTRGRCEAGSRQNWSRVTPWCSLTQDVELAEWAGLLQHQPGVHAVTMELVFTGEHPEPLGKGEAQVGIPALEPGTKIMMWGRNPCRVILGVKGGSAQGSQVDLRLATARIRTCLLQK